MLKIKNIVKLGTIGGDAHNKCNLKYSVPKEIPIVLHNGSNYDYHLIMIIKDLSEEQFTRTTYLFRRKY